MATQTKRAEALTAEDAFAQIVKRIENPKGCTLVEGAFRRLTPSAYSELSRIAKRGCLIVAVHADASGPVSASARLASVKALKFVDYAFLLKGPLDPLVEQLKPDLLCSEIDPREGLFGDQSFMMARLNEPRPTISLPEPEREKAEADIRVVSEVARQLSTRLSAKEIEGEPPDLLRKRMHGEKQKDETSGQRPPSRVGRTPLTAFVERDIAREFKAMAALQGRSNQSMIEEGLAFLFNKYGKPEMARKVFEPKVPTVD